MSWVSCLVLLLTASSCLVSAQYALNATGATFPGPVYADWIFAFELLSTNTTIHYSLTGSGAGIKAIKVANSTVVDFAGSDSPLSAVDYSEGQPVGIKSFPFVVGSIVLAYNIPGAPAIADFGTLVLSREAVTGIFNGTIRYWNDSIIVDAQESEVAGKPGWKTFLSKATASITPTIRLDKSGTTTIFTTALTSFSSGWKSTYGPTSTFNANLYNGTVASHVRATGNFGVLAAVASKTWSIGYVSLSQVIQDEYLSYARLKNRDGNIVSASADFVRTAASQATFSANLTADIVDLPGRDSYPIAGVTYILIQSNEMPYHDCQRRRETWKFFNYILTDAKSNQRAAAKGFASIPDELAKEVLALLGNVTCNGQSLLDFEVVEQYPNGFIVPVSVVIGICGILSCFGIIWFIVQLMAPRNKLPLALLLFGLITCFSGLIAYAGVGMWLIVPSNGSVCMSRVWLGSIGITLLLASSISRASQIHTYAQVMKSKNAVADLSTLGQQKLWLTFIDVFVMLGIQLVIDIIWHSVDPYRPVLVVLDAFKLTAEWQCQSDTIALWAVEAAYIGLIVLYGVAQIYRSWSIASRINQSRWILLSLYNVMLTGAACLPIIALVEGEKNLATVAISGLLFITFQIQGSFLFPTVVYEAAVASTSSLSRSKKGSSSDQPSRRSRR